MGEEKNNEYSEETEEQIPQENTESTETETNLAEKADTEETPKPKPKKKEAAVAELPAEAIPKRRGRPKGSLNKTKPKVQEPENDDSPVETYANPPEKTISAITSLLQDFEARQAARQTKRSQFYSSFLPR